MKKLSYKEVRVIELNPMITFIASESSLNLAQEHHYPYVQKPLKCDWLLRPKNYVVVGHFY
jgi:hypothetical protein